MFESSEAADSYGYEMWFGKFSKWKGCSPRLVSVLSLAYLTDIQVKEHLKYCVTSVFVKNRDDDDRVIDV